MNRTDTQSKLNSLLVDADRVRRRRRGRTRGAGVLVAAAAAIAVTAAVTVLGRPEATEPAQQLTPAEQVATAALDAWASFDRPRVASYLADDAEIDASWRRDNRWDEAVGYRTLNESCVEQTSTTSGTRVVCTYDYHALGSDELGLGPYSDSTALFTIDDGKILTAERRYAFARDGFRVQMWEPFAAWIVETHPKDAALMYAHWPYQDSPALTDRSLELWAERTRDYVNEKK